MIISLLAASAGVASGVQASPARAGDTTAAAVAGASTASYTVVTESGALYSVRAGRARLLRRSVAAATYDRTGRFLYLVTGGGLYRSAADGTGVVRLATAASLPTVFASSGVREVQRLVLSPDGRELAVQGQELTVVTTAGRYVNSTSVRGTPRWLPGSGAVVIDDRDVFAPHLNRLFHGLGVAPAPGDAWSVDRTPDLGTTVFLRPTYLSGYSTGSYTVGAQRADGSAPWTLGVLERGGAALPSWGGALALNGGTVVVNDQQVVAELPLSGGASDVVFRAPVAGGRLDLIRSVEPAPPSAAATVPPPRLPSFGVTAWSDHLNGGEATVQLSAPVQLGLGFTCAAASGTIAPSAPSNRGDDEQPCYLGDLRPGLQHTVSVWPRRVDGTLGARQTRIITVPAQPVARTGVSRPVAPGRPAVLTATITRGGRAVPHARAVLVRDPSGVREYLGVAAADTTGTVRFTVSRPGPYWVGLVTDHPVRTFHLFGSSPQISDVFSVVVARAAS